MAASTAVRNWNFAAQASRGDVLFVIADDLIPPRNWDRKIAQIVGSREGNFDLFAMKVSDSEHPDDRLLRHPICSAAFFKRFGLFDKAFTGVYCDDDFSLRAFWRSYILDGRKIVFNHARREVDGRTKLNISQTKINQHSEASRGKEVFKEKWPAWFRESRIQLVAPKHDHRKSQVLAHFYRLSSALTSASRRAKKSRALRFTRRLLRFGIRAVTEALASTTREIRRLLKRSVLKPIAHVFRSGKPIFFFFPKSRQRANLKFQEKKNLRDWVFKDSYLGLQTKSAAVYLHIPKTGGTYIANQLIEHCGFEFLDPRNPPSTNRLIIEHYSLNWLVSHRVLALSFLREAKVFTVVRNPVDRGISAFGHLKKMGAIPNDWSLQKFLRYLKLEDPEIGGGRVARMSHAAPQVKWLPHETEIPRVSAFKLESIDEMNSWCRSHLGCSPKLEFIPKAADPVVQLSNSDIRMLADYYREDFGRFNY